MLRVTMRVSVCLFLYLASLVSSENILGIFPTTAKSAFLASEAVMKALAKRGHNVTVISCFPQKEPIINYTDISIRSLREILESNLDFKRYDFPYSLLDLNFFFLELIDSMDDILKSHELKTLLSSDSKFHVVFHEMFIDNVFLMIARKFKVPIIAIGPSYILPWAADRFAIPQNPAYIPVLGNRYSRYMNFFERISNTVSLIRNNINYWQILVAKSLEVYGRHFQEIILGVKEAGNDVSMYFVNTHFSYYGARPYPPQVVEIGGIHIQPAGTVPQELAKWMDESSLGVICLSFGSALRVASLPEDKVQIFLKVFSRIPQRVLWKWEADEEIKGLPENVKLMKWLPQRDVLAHPKMRLFISHGGLLGTTEAVVSGVPVLGIPTNMDQANNVAALVDNGMAMYLDYKNVTVENMFYAVHHMLLDTYYSNNAKLLQSRFQDRPQTPEETAVYWTEYVMRHSGAPHLQSAAVHLTWYQYYLLDVAAVCLAVLLAALAVVYYTLRFCIWQLCCVKTTKIKTS